MPENKGEAFLSPEIAKLFEKLQKDPSSKLFFPLAEEYIKCSMLEEAIMVLTDGLKTHPGFHAARVSLGKVYLQKGRVAEAKAEFEKVVAQNPDNLMAQKKLAFIYRDEGSVEKAQQICKTFLLANPKDLEMKSLLAELENLQSKSAAKEVSQVPAVEPASSQAPSAVSEPVVSPPEVSKGSSSAALLDHEAIKPPPPQPATEAVPGALPPEKSSMPPPTIQNHEAQANQHHPEESPQNSGERKVPVVELNLDEAESGLNEEDIFSELLGAMPSKPQGPTMQGAAPSQAASSVSLPQQEQEERSPGLEGDLATVTLAELYVKQGHYEQGIEIYRKILEHDPENEEIRQRLEDAMALANLLTKRPKEPRQKDMVKFQESPPKAQGEPTTAQPARSSPEQLRQAKVQRLQAWLEQLKRSQNP
jgi:tetratricopeptide (TPR) repeat protein